MSLCSQNVEGPAAARACQAGSRTECGYSKLELQFERMHPQLVNMMSMIVTHNRLCDGSLENATWRGEQIKQNSIGNNDIIQVTH